MKSFAEVIERWPSAVEFARDVEVKDVTARAWKARGIPSEYWQRVMAAAEKRMIVGVTYELLASLAARRLTDRKAPQEQAVA